MMAGATWGAAGMAVAKAVAGMAVGRAAAKAGETTVVAVTAQHK